MTVRIGRSFAKVRNSTLRFGSSSGGYRGGKTDQNRAPPFRRSSFPNALGGLDGDHMIGPTTPTGGERSVETEHRGLSLHRASTTQLAEAELAPVFRQAQRHLTRYAARLVEEDETEDVVQETLLKFVMQRRRERDTGGGRPRARERAEPLPPLSKRDVIIRLTVMLKDVVIDRERARRKETKMMRLISGASATIRRHMSTRRRVEDDEIRSAIQYALLRLPAYMREPWVMVKEQGFSVDETAHHFGITRASVRAAMAEANRAMRPHLERFGITPDIIRGRDIE